MLFHATPFSILSGPSADDPIRIFPGYLVLSLIVFRVPGGSAPMRATPMQLNSQMVAFVGV